MRCYATRLYGIYVGFVCVRVVSLIVNCLCSIKKRVFQLERIEFLAILKMNNEKNQQKRVYKPTVNNTNIDQAKIIQRDETKKTSEKKSIPLMKSWAIIFWFYYEIFNERFTDNCSRWKPYKCALSSFNQKRLNCGCCFSLSLSLIPSSAFIFVSFRNLSFVSLFIWLQQQSVHDTYWTYRMYECGNVRNIIVIVSTTAGECDRPQLKISLSSPLSQPNANRLLLFFLLLVLLLRVLMSFIIPCNTFTSSLTSNESTN